MPETYGKYKIRFSLIIELTLPFGSSLDMVRKVKNLSANFKHIASQYFTLLNILICIVRYILSLYTRIASI